jgi:HK97 family phage portal protein
MWGQALLEGRKPQTKIEFVNAFSSWVFICVRLNFQAVASVPLRLYVAKKIKGQKFKTIETRPLEKERLRWIKSKDSLDPWLTKAAEVEEVTDHAWLELLKEVNPENGKRDLLEMTSMFQDLTGEAYWYMPKAKETPGQIWVIPSQFINPVFGKSLDKAIDHYDYERGSANISLPADEVVMFRYPNPSNIFTGFSIIKGIAEAVYLQKQMNDFEISLLENKARPGGILSPKEKMSKAELERARETFRQKYAGARKAGKTLIPPAGMEFIRDTMTPQEISFIEGRRLNRTEIMAAYDIPEAVIVSESSNRSVAEAADYRHAKYGILPRCRKIEDRINEKVMPLYDDKLFVAFDDPVPEDKEFNLRKQVEQTKANISLINEERAAEGKEPIEGGDTGWVPFNFMPMGGISEKEVEEFSKKVLEKVKEALND